MKRLICLIAIIIGYSHLSVGQQTAMPEQKQLILDSIQLAYTDMGSGQETIIFIHGLGGSRQHWQQNMQAFSEDFRSIAIDLPGYGASRLQAVPQDSLLYFFADALVALMDSLRIPKAHICGHSMGGQLAILFSLENPDRVNKLVLAAPAGLEAFTEAEGASLKNYARSSFPVKQSEAQIRMNYAANFHQMPETAEGMIQERLRLNNSSYFPIYANVLVGGVQGMIDTPVANRLSEIRQPVLIVFGAEDKLIPNRLLHPGLTTESVAHAGQEAIPGSRLKIIPEAGHLLMFEKPDAFNETVKNFLTNRNTN